MTFAHIAITGSGGSAASRSVTSSESAHQHLIEEVNTDAAPLPYPKFKRLIAIKNTAESITIPSNGIVISPIPPGTVDPEFWSQVTSSYPAAVMLGKETAFNNGQDSLSNIDSSWTTESISSSAGTHDHLFLTTASIYTYGGTQRTVYNTLTNVAHTHPVSATISISEIRSKVLKFWKTAKDTIASDKIMMLFEGDVNSLPAGWKFCDGFDGTIDMTGYLLSIADEFTDHGTVLGTENKVDLTVTLDEVLWTHSHQGSQATAPGNNLSMPHRGLSAPHSHTGILEGIADVYSPPTIKLGFIQYFEEPQNTIFEIISSSLTVIEGDTVRFTLNASNVNDGTKIFYAVSTIDGDINQNDFFGDTRGEVLLESGAAEISLEINRDLTKEYIAERFKVIFYKDIGLTSILTESPTIEIQDTSFPIGSIPTGAVVLYDDPAENPTVPAGWTIDSNTNHKDKLILFASNQTEINSTSFGGWSSNVNVFTGISNDAGTHTFSNLTYTQVKNFGTLSGSVMSSPSGVRSAHNHSAGSTSNSMNLNEGGKIYPPFRRYHMLVRTGLPTNVIPANCVIFAKYSPGPLWTEITYSSRPASIDRDCVLTGRSIAINNGDNSTDSIDGVVYLTSSTSGVHTHRSDPSNRGTTLAPPGTSGNVDDNLSVGNHTHNVKISLYPTDLRTVSLKAWKTASNSPIGANAEILLLYKDNLSILPDGWFFADGQNDTIDTRNRYLSLAHSGNTHGELIGTTNTIGFYALFEDNTTFPRFAEHNHQAGRANRAYYTSSTAYHTNSLWPHSHFTSDFQTSTLYTMPYIRYAAIQYFFPGNSESNIYDFEEHVFTNAGVVGRLPPTVTDLRSEYQTSWDENGSYFTVVSGKQKWQVPTTGFYYIEASGAQGGGIAGGLGATVGGEFYLIAGEYLHMAVGQKGSLSINPTSEIAVATSGGGASVVNRSSSATDISDSTILLVAGGGGGCNLVTPFNDSDDRHGSIDKAGKPSSNIGVEVLGGENGLGGNQADETLVSIGCGAGGGGIFANGIGNTHVSGGSRWSAAFYGGGDSNTGTTTYDTLKVFGGFGGGGAAYHNFVSSIAYSSAGGGGGYSGGAGGRATNTTEIYGGGGGSFNGGSNQKNLAAHNIGDGRIFIRKLIVPAVPLPPPPSYTVIVNDYTATENQILTITVTTEFVDSGTVLYWDVEAVDDDINASDFVASDGSVTIDEEGNGTATITPRADNFWEGGRDTSESFKIRLFTDADRTNLVARTESIQILDTSSPVVQILSGMAILYSGTVTSSSTSIAGWSSTLRSYINNSPNPLYIKGTDQIFTNTSTITTESIGTNSFGVTASDSRGTHTGSTFVGGNYGTTTVGASNGYPFATGAGANHTHDSYTPLLSEFDYPYPLTSYLEILIASSNTFVIPQNGIVFGEYNPNPGYWAEYTRSGYPALVPQGSSLRNTDISSPSIETIFTTSNGVHQHKLNSDNYWFTAGNTFFWYLDNNEGQHQHAQEITLSVDALKSKNLKAWRCTTTNTANGRIFAPGTIVMWLSSSTTIPAGWQLCDGTNGSVDMRDFYLSINSSGHNVVISQDTRLKATYGPLQSATVPHQHRGSYISNIRTNSASTFHSNTVDWIHSHLSAVESKTLSSNDYPDIYDPPTIPVRFIQKTAVVQQSPEYPYYNFISHTFTNVGITGNYGPTLTDCKSAYAGTVWVDDDRLFSVSYGKQKWTVPKSGFYRITARGAQGGSPTGSSGGFGAIIEGVFYLNKGERIDILVGQTPIVPTAYRDIASGGGGGTYVIRDGGTTDSDILVIAGGGGGTGMDRPDNANASITTEAKAPAIRPDNTSGVLLSNYSIDGKGGSSYDGNTGGGGGFLTDGRSSGTVNTFSGKGYANKSTGGYSSTTSLGGFGGGGAVILSNTFYRYAGGGGYSGGQGSDDFPSTFGFVGVCSGGGSSYNNGIEDATYSRSASAGNTGHGSVNIVFITA